MRFSALVPMLYTLTCGKIPVTTELKYFHEFDVENRAQGDAGHGILAAVLGPLRVSCLLMAQREHWGSPGIYPLSAVKRT